MSKAPYQMDEAIALLSRASRVLVVSHFNPDADALGSSCGLALALQGAGKSVVVVNESTTPDRFYFIPGAKEVLSSFPDDPFDVICVCDCGEESRVGDKFLKRISGATPTINFDHHTSNGLFGTVNLVDEHASSTSEIVFELVKAMGLPLSKPVAECLYTGILGDTGAFTYSCTTPKVFAIAQELLAAGVQPAEIASAYFDSWTPERLKLYSMALGAVCFHRSGEIAEIVITPEMFSAANASLDDADGIVERARGVKGVRVAFIAIILPELIKVSLRGKDSSVNLSKVAREFGGGGHKAAAAFRWRKSLSGMRENLLALLGEEMKRGADATA